MLTALPLALIAAVPQTFASLPAPGAVLQVSCRQGQCVWQQWRTIETLRDRAAEKLVKITSRRGTSIHRDRIPERYSSRIGVEWEADPRIEYVLCSMTRPTTVFRSGGEYVVTPIHLTGMAGYEYAAGTIYMAACHARAPGKWKEADIPKLGYAAGIGGGQQRFATIEHVMRALD